MAALVATPRSYIFLPSRRKVTNFRSVSGRKTLTLAKFGRENQQLRSGGIVRARISFSLMPEHSSCRVTVSRPRAPDLSVLKDPFPEVSRNAGIASYDVSGEWGDVDENRAHGSDAVWE